MTVRTRFAPSPTGFLHIGGARTALYSWAFARRHGGRFILRIEDTDTERSTRESEAAILDSMKWLGLEWDEGPWFQMQRLARYREAAERLIAGGHAYRCWATKEELEEMREAQRARGDKPRYDGRWRPERAQAAGLVPPADRPPVVRFRTPDEGTVGWKDLVKGLIEFPNAELDDLVLLRADGVPTYNFGVVVDDLDMAITHVIRGDDHVNNTPRQIHIWRALGAQLPEFAHVPMILGADGERLSKRHGAVSVTQYRDEGFLPEALANYLARLGWSHGDAEMFTLRQLVDWFDLAHVSHSPARFDAEKLAWLNQQHMKQADDARLAALSAPFLGRTPANEVVALLKERAASVKELAAQAAMFYTEPGAQPVPAEAKPALAALRRDLEALAWERKALGAAVAAAAKAHGLKMPQLAMPLRRVLTGREQTPSIDAVLELLGRETVLARIAKALA
jgi:glutamyl-tRNA synthetase